jgi:hypothetical protein
MAQDKRGGTILTLSLAVYGVPSQTPYIGETMLLSLLHSYSESNTQSMSADFANFATHSSSASQQWQSLNDGSDSIQIQSLRPVDFKIAISDFYSAQA